MQPGSVYAIKEGKDAVEQHTLSILVDNFRTDTDPFWDDNISEDDLAEVAMNEVPTAETDTTTFEVGYGPGADEPTVTDDGDGEVTLDWDDQAGTLTITIEHRGPVEVALK